jgi:hypothetical protein
MHQRESLAPRRRARRRRPAVLPTPVLGNWGKVPAALYTHSTNVKVIAVTRSPSNHSRWYAKSRKPRHCASELTMPQLDRLVGLSMLIAATSIFVYYTVWTLFMVCAHPLKTSVTISRAPILTVSAIRRRRPFPPQPLPATRLGHPHPCHPHHSRLHRCRQLPLRRHDQEQSQEGPQGPAEEGIIE